MFFDDENDTTSEPKTENKSKNECDKMYEMGSPYELSEEECEEAFLEKKMNEFLVSEESKDYVHIFTRTDGGYIEQLKNHLNIDLNHFDYNNLRNKREKIKILYLLYKIKVNFPNVNVLALLNKHSMENIDYPLYETYNGEYTYYIANELRKEMDRKIINEIDNLFFSNSTLLDDFLGQVSYNADYLCSSAGNDSAKEYIDKKIKKISTYKFSYEKKYNFSPVEAIYFRIWQYKYIGQIKDIIFINSIDTGLKNEVPLSMIDEMKAFAKCKIKVNEIEEFINKTKEIAKYVFLRDNITSNDLKKIRNQNDKVKQMINFLFRAAPLKNVDDSLDKLHIISFLQAIILDEKNEIFDYTFYGYQKHMKHKQHVQVSINPNKHPTDALKVYWSRKINDHWYANIGRHEIRYKLRELENVCDKIYLDFLSNMSI